MRKTKARDIVAGWPKGRSTSILRLLEGDYLFTARLHGGYPEGWADIKREFLYREAQQQMVNAYFERWRTRQD